jgi:hypothetical protein
MDILLWVLERITLFRNCPEEGKMIVMTVMKKWRRKNIRKKWI